MKIPVLVSFFNKVTGLQPAALSKKRLPYRCFPVHFAKILRHVFLKYTFGCLLLVEGWISLKWCQYLLLLMFLTLVTKESSYFSIT